jgi:hypothetical protein
VLGIWISSGLDVFAQQGNAAAMVVHRAGELLYVVLRAWNSVDNFFDSAKDI